MKKKLKHLLQAEIDPAFAKRAQFILQEIEKRKPKIVLDAGCGRGFYTRAVSLFPFVTKIYGIDINQVYINIAKKQNSQTNIVYKKASMYHLPFPDHFFDSVICSEVLEHLSDEHRALSEIWRVLKPNGTLLVTVPHANYPFLWDPINWTLERLFKIHIPKTIWWLAGIWADHERLYTKNGIISVIRSNRFSVEKRQEVIRWCWPFSHFILYGIGKNIVERTNITSFNRFSFHKKGFFILLLSRIFRLPSLLFDSLIPLSSSVNICITARKK